jgi:hypothetical protein
MAVLPFGSQSGLHVPNYLINSRTGNVPHAIQAGSVYGPVAFPNVSIVNTPSPVPVTKAAMYTGYAQRNFSGNTFR